MFVWMLFLGDKLIKFANFVCRTLKYIPLTVHFFINFNNNDWNVGDIKYLKNLSPIHVAIWPIKPNSWVF